MNNNSKSTLVTKCLIVRGKRTSIRLEPEMLQELKRISKIENCTISELVTLIHIRKNKNMSLTSSVRVFLMMYYRAASNTEGHSKAGHGDFNKMLKRANLPREKLLRSA